MTRVTALILVGLFCLAAFGCRRPTPRTMQMTQRSSDLLEKEPEIETDIFIYEKDDEVKATDKLITFLEDNAFDVSRFSEDIIKVYYDGTTFLFMPMPTIDNLDRIVVSRHLNIKPEYKKTQKVKDFVQSLNEGQNIACFSILDDEEEGLLEMKGNITFVNKLSVDEIKKFMQLYERAVPYVAILIPESLDVLE